MFCIVTFAARIGCLKKTERVEFRAFFPKCESLDGNRMNTHAAHNLRGMRSHHAHSLSTESEVVSSECDNREWRCVPVSRDWLEEKKKRRCVFYPDKPRHAQQLSSQNRTPNMANASTKTPQNIIGQHSLIPHHLEFLNYEVISDFHLLE